MGGQTRFFRHGRWFLWSTTKGFKKKRSPISALKGNTGIAYTDEEKAETLANSLESQFQLNNISNPTQDNNHIRLVTRFFNNENNFDDSPSITKPSEIVQIINNFKIKKAPGREGITNKMCKHFTRSVVFQLTNIINNILTVGYFPKIWKTASVIPILKPGKDPTLPDSFRPISLLPVLSKITEKIIQKRLCQHLNDNDILIPQQHGFRAGLSTSHQLLRVVEYIKTGFRDRKSTGAVFLDIQKAFDRRPLSGRSYSGQSGYSKNRDQKVREKITGGGNMGCGTKESDLLAEPGVQIMGNKYFARIGSKSEHTAIQQSWNAAKF
ncbi:RNA-directed DNA polymerase from mobile element jockey [Trichonephila clavipes]|nr:RNA-directed DNA polymerase from mobile element jockey [Trichonephila clavipes]